MADLPQIDVQKKREEEEKEKKRAGMAGYFSRGSSSTFGGARGGLGSFGSWLERLFGVEGGATGGFGGGGFAGSLARILATTGGKAAVLLFLAALGSGAYLAGRSMSPNPSDFLLGRRHHVGAAKDGGGYGEISGLPTYPKAPKDSLGLIAGGSDIYGQGQREGGAAATDGAGAAGAAKDAGAAGEAKAGDKNGKDADAIARALMNGAAKQANSANDASRRSAFGNRSSLSPLGGIGGFGGSATAASMQAAGGAANGDKSHGKLSGFPSPSRLGVQGANARANMSRNTGKNAFGQLRNAALLSGTAANPSNTTAEAAKQGATSAFQGPGTDGAITGAGASPGGAGAQPGASRGTEFGSGGPTSAPGTGDTSSSPGTGGGPGSAANNNNATSNCDVMSQDVGMSLTANNSGGCVPNANATNVTPWQGLADIAMIALMAAGLLLLLAEVFSKMGPAMRVAAQVCAWLACIAGAIAAVVGALMVYQGQMMQGAIYTVMGAIISYSAYKVAQGLEKAPDVTKTTQGLAQNQDAQAALKAQNIDPKSVTFNPDTGQAMTPNGPLQGAGGQTFFANSDGSIGELAQGSPIPGSTVNGTTVPKLPPGTPASGTWTYNPTTNAWNPGTAPVAPTAPATPPSGGK